MDRMEHLDDVDRVERLDLGDDLAHRDHFERQLARLMHTQEQTPFGPGHRDRLRAGVVTRRRVRAARRAAGSVLAVAGLGLGVFLWPHAHTDDRPSAPHPRPAISPTSGPSTSPSPSRSASGPPPSYPTTQQPPDADTTTSDPPAGPGSTATGQELPSATATSSDEATAPPPTVTPSDVPSSQISPSG
ncbi:hypothetical protein ACGFT2_15155 [Streptomyces sp. NPDC048514]|uniref:hypothetical protein n=1 Tax=Streptomyces sp. NPDC048514 TaxID=3365564 RepID=UPI0037121BB3